MKFYAGIGSRETPEQILVAMRDIAIELRNRGWWLRSGGAAGADSAFESGSAGMSEIYRPAGATTNAMRMAGYYHPNWGACNDYVRKLHGRNSQIILGKDLDKCVDFIVCYTPGGQITGGTGQALRIARALHIPVFNMGNPEWDTSSILSQARILWNATTPAWNFESWQDLQTENRSK